MRKRGRVSAAAIGVTPVRISARERPAPPAGLTARERRQWNEITGALRPDWFEAENLPLLTEYCRCAELCTRLSRELRKVEVLDPTFDVLSRRKLMAVNMLMRLATKLRLTAAEAVGALRRTQATRWGAVWLQLAHKKSSRRPPPS